MNKCNKYYINKCYKYYAKNFDDEKVRYKMDCHIVHTVFWVIILPFIICYHYAKIGHL